MEQDELRRQAQQQEQAPPQLPVQPSRGGGMGSKLVSSGLDLFSRLKPKRKPTTPDRLIRTGTERLLSTNPLTGKPITVGELYGIRSNKGTQEVPAEALRVKKAFDEGATLEDMEVVTGLTPHEIQRGIAYLKSHNEDLREWE